MIMLKNKNKCLRKDKRLQEQRKITIQWTFPSNKWGFKGYLEKCCQHSSAETHTCCHFSQWKSCLKSCPYRGINVHKVDVGWLTLCCSPTILLLLLWVWLLLFTFYANLINHILLHLRLLSWITALATGINCLWQREWGKVCAAINKWS